MLQITPHHRLLLATRHVDFRKGIEGLSALCRQVLEEDPLGGAIFIFTNRLKTSIKILLYDGNGFWLCQKRFSQGKLAWWPPLQESQTLILTPSQLHILLAQGNPQTTQTPSDWRSVSPGKTKPLSSHEPLAQESLDRPKEATHGDP